MTVVAAYDESSVPLASLPLTFSTADTKALLGVGISGSGVGALRKHAGGMFLASDLGGYAAVVSILISTAKLELSQWYRARCSAPGGEGTGGSFRCFCLLLSLVTKVGRSGERSSPQTSVSKKFFLSYGEKCGTLPFEPALFAGLRPIDN